MPICRGIRGGAAEPLIGAVHRDGRLPARLAVAAEEPYPAAKTTIVPRLGMVWSHDALRSVVPVP
jgi:hypothetical protein